MTGRRLPDNTARFEPGDYGRDGGYWWVWPPGAGHMGRLSPRHQVTEHEDGSVTVAQLIALPPDDGCSAGWGGWLERGHWREA